MSEPQVPVEVTSTAEAVEAARQEFLALLEEGREEAAAERLAALHPADQADMLRDVEPARRAAILPDLSVEALAHIIEHLTGKDRGRLVDQLPARELARILNHADSDIAADVLRHIGRYDTTRVLASMLPARAAQVIPLLVHEDESAGGRMTRGYVTLLGQMTADEAITYLRLTKPDAQEVYYLYVLDDEDRMEGVVSLRELIIAPPDMAVADLMSRDVISVPPDVDQEECAQLLRRYNLLSLPVVDEEGRLQGVLTGDDLIDVLQEEATEDMYRMVGIDQSESLRGTVIESVRRRLPWLLINLVTAFVAASIVAGFESTIERVAVVAVFMPVIAGQGGNTGMQSLTLIVRSIALGEIGSRRVGALFRREVLIGLANGALIGSITGAGAYALSGGDWLMALIVATAMVLNMVVAASAGVLVPLGLRALHTDPALASSIFVTAVTDAVGFLLLLSMATIFVSQLD